MKLSIVFGGRNDNYGGNFTERTLLALNRNLAEAQKYEVDLEWIWVEWNPPNENYLAYLLAPLGVTCYVVSPAIHARVVKGALVWHEGFDRNVGYRRAKGDWLLGTNPDVVFSPPIWEFWQRGEFDRETLYRAERHDLGCQYFSEPFPVMRAHVILKHRMSNPEMTNACGDFAMFSNTYGLGYNEAIDFTGVHMDSNFMFNWPHKFELLTGPVYKADHPMIGHRIYRKEPELWLATRGSDTWDCRAKYTNPPDWGFAGYPTHELADGITFIEEKS